MAMGYTAGGEVIAMVRIRIRIRIRVRIRVMVEIMIRVRCAVVTGGHDLQL